MISYLASVWWYYINIRTTINSTFFVFLAHILMLVLPAGHFIHSFNGMHSAHSATNGGKVAKLTRLYLGRISINIL